MSERARLNRAIDRLSKSGEPNQPANALAALLDVIDDTILIRKLTFNCKDQDQPLSIVAGNRRLYWVDGPVMSDQQNRVNEILEEGGDVRDPNAVRLLINWLNSNLENCETNNISPSQNQAGDGLTAMGMTALDLAKFARIQLHAPTDSKLAQDFQNFLDTLSKSSLSWCALSSDGTFKRHARGQAAALLPSAEQMADVIENYSTQPIQGIKLVTYERDETTTLLVAIHDSRAVAVILDKSEPADSILAKAIRLIEG